MGSVKQVNMSYQVKGLLAADGLHHVATCNWKKMLQYQTRTSLDEPCLVNPLPNDIIPDWSKLKAFADDKIKVPIIIISSPEHKVLVHLSILSQLQKKKNLLLN